MRTKGEASTQFYCADLIRSVERQTQHQNALCILFAKIYIYICIWSSIQGEAGTSTHSATTKQGLVDVQLVVINHHCKHIIICDYWGNIKVELQKTTNEGNGFLLDKKCISTLRMTLVV